MNTRDSTLSQPESVHQFTETTFCSTSPGFLIFLLFLGSGERGVAPKPRPPGCGMYSIESNGLERGGDIYTRVLYKVETILCMLF